MFMGVSSIQQAKPCSSYSDAVRNFEAAQKTPTGKPRKPGDYGYPLGAHYKSVTNIRMDGTDVVMRLYDTDVVTWHEDDRVTIDNWTSKTTAEFIGRFSPVVSNASSEITYSPAPHGSESGDWRAYWDASMVVCGDGTFRRNADGGWEPESLDTFQKFHTAQVDTKAMRQLAKDHHLADFRSFLESTCLIPNLVHEGADCGIVAEALLARDFRRAACHLPTVEDKEHYGRSPTPLNIATAQRNQLVSMTSLQRFKDWLADAEGALTTTVFQTLSHKLLDKLKARNRALAKANAGGWRLGWNY